MLCFCKPLSPIILQLWTQVFGAEWRKFYLTLRTKHGTCSVKAHFIFPDLTLVIAEGCNNIILLLLTVLNFFSLIVVEFLGFQQ